ncbi:MAG TPA: tetratricopeptide repeat protein [Anaerolineales bacterium]|nr:tetratricopeptide repeat protein [Anaerolineales bacterium]
MAEDVMLQEAIDAISRGQRQRARDLFTRLLRADQANPTYWLWMSSVVDTPKERRYCLQNVLRLEPGNRSARRGLVLMGALSPPEDLRPVPPVHRKWSVIENEFANTTNFRLILSNVNRRTWGFLGAGIVLISLLFLGIFGTRSRAGALAVKLTITPRPRTPRPTATLLPTNTPWSKTATPTFTGPTPLWMLLEATYTPTPLYIETPHPISEAFRAGIRAFHSGDLSSMLQFMQQAAEVEPDAPDTHYYIGEAYRLIGELDKALEAYEMAIQINPNFAPAFLGRARVHLVQDPDAIVEEDLTKAITDDPGLADAYLERAAYLLRHGDPQAAMQDLDSLAELLPESPMLYLYRAQAYLDLGQTESALESAQQAHDLDQTLLPAYLTLAEAYIQLGDANKGIDLLDTFVLYEKQDPVAWSLLGEAFFEQGKFEKALEALDRAIELDEDSLEAYLNRGSVYLAQDEGQLAVNDFFEARRLQPDSFQASFGMGRALWMAGRINDAVRQFKSSEDLASTDEQLAQVYYWRAKIFEDVGNYLGAAGDWQALLELPAGSAPEKWTIEVENKLLALTPSPTPTATGTATPTPTSTNTSTPTPDWRALPTEPYPHPVRTRRH